MLAGETAPIIQLPCEKTTLALTVGCAGKEVKAAGRAGHGCQGSGREINTGHPPAMLEHTTGTTAVPRESAGHFLAFFHQTLL